MRKNFKKTLQALKNGDLIDIVAPGFGCSQEDLQAGVEWLRKEGFVPRVTEDIFGPDLLHAQEEKKRAKDLIRALKAKDSKAIWFLRGGYGSNRLLPYLKKTKSPNKILIGISDISSIHSYSVDRWKMPVLHGPLLDRIAKGLVPPTILTEVLQVLRGEISTLEFDQLTPLNKSAQKKSNLQAEIVGGNLKVIESHIGTPDQLKTQGRFLMFEEIGERAYRVDRMLFHFEQAGLFKGVRGVLLGQFIQDQEPGGQPGKTKELLEAWAKKQKFPVVSGLPCGHDVEQRILPLGTQAQLKTGLKPQLTVITGIRK